MNNTQISLTKNQKLLWIGQELNPESPLYNMVMTYEIKDKISLNHFKLAFNKLVKKSDVLRYVFEIKNNEPVQKCLSNINYEIDFVDFSNEKNPKASYQLWLKERVKILFDLTICAFDCVLIKCSENHFIWYMNQHHLITDGWSSTILFSTMAALYAQELTDDVITTIELPLYSDFANHIEKTSKSDKNEKVLKHWDEKQKTFPSAPALYHEKDALLDTASERLHIKLGKPFSDKIREFANQKGVRMWTVDLTLYNIFLTALFAYINRITDQERIVIGSPTHNRTSKNFKNTIGFFVETFPLLTEVEESETFASLLKKTQIESNSFLKNAIAGTSTSELNRGFNVFFNYINTFNPDFNGAPVKTEWVHSGHHDPRHHLRLHVHDFDNSGDIQLYFDLNKSIFNTEKQSLVPKHFLKLLEAFIDNQNQSISSVNLITDHELLKIKEWNNTTINYPKNETLLSKFETQVLKTPNQTALIFEKTSINYKTLEERSNQVAHFLLQKGIKKNDIVAVSFNRSLDMMIYIYGIIKAGAAYLPIDVNTPSERLDFIIHDADAKILFYNHDTISNSILKKIDSLNIDVIDNEISLLEKTQIQIDILPNDLAYIIYTSGSTGEPKGVKCHHEGICNRLNWMNDDYPITSKDKFLQKTPITFDVSVWELFWPLQAGATLVIESPEGHKHPDKLIKTIQEHQVTNIHFVPSMLNVFMETESVTSCKSLNRFFCSGEALSVPVVEKTYEKLNVEIYNLYGPTEASVDVTSWHCKKEETSKSIPIGKPVANTQLYILDKSCNQLPIGLKGELYIAGRQVAKGYLNREKLTKERFVKNIFSDEPHAIMYKTGDLVRYRADAAIEYHGRLDNQVKIRGLRIELGEIEKTIENYTNATQVIVIIDKKDNLVAYYTGKKITDSEIINNLEQRLPEYMIPQFYSHLESFKLLSSGKVDRKNLPDYNKALHSKIIVVKDEPRNEIDEIILSVWKEVLEIEKIGVNENFIRIGGNSLNAISITSRLKAILELDVSITDVFNYPTIAAYSNHVEQVITALLNE